MDFATEVDRHAEAEIVRELKRAFPDHGILAEEADIISMIFVGQRAVAKLDVDDVAQNLADAAC